MANLDSLINQLHMSYDCERKPEYQRKAYTAKENPYSQGEHTERSKPSRRVEPWTKAAAQWAITFKDQNDSLYRQYTSFLCYDAGHLSMTLGHLGIYLVLEPA